MKWQDYLKALDSGMTSDDFEHILWSWTSYPMGGARRVMKQFSSHIRASRSRHKTCWFCQANRNFKHRSWCPTHEGINADSMP